MAIGKIERVDLREVWAHEAHDFTTWLAQNIDVVSEATELSLSSVEREQAAGSFSVDLVAEEADGGTVVIENQLGRSDHDHLGKLLTYLSAFEARAAVWIVGDARPEHTAAVAWLNESTAADFYLLKAEAIRIGDSAPALLLTRIVGPSEEAKAVGTEKREQSDRERIRRAFWGELLERAKQRTPLHTGVNPSRHPWQGTGAGIAGLSYQYGIRQHAWSVFLYIDRGSGADEENKRIFAYLHDRREQIEARFGSELSWDRLEGKRAAAIGPPSGEGGYRDEQDKWPQIQDQMIDAMINLERAFKGELRPAVDAAQ